jgi:cytochrome c-type biogenesis protein CcmE
MNKRFISIRNVIPALLIGILAGCTVALLPVNSVLQYITITGYPAKIDYSEGEALDISGLVVTGTYTDGTTKVEAVSLSNITGYDPYRLGIQTLIVRVSDKMASFEVVVNPAVSGGGEGTLQSIAVTSWPAKTFYAPGEELDISGLVVTGIYSNGGQKTITVSLSNISGYNPGIVGTQTLTVTVDGKQAFFTVQVQTGGTADLQSIELTSGPTKFVYAQGEALDISGLVITGTYSNGGQKTETVSLSDISGYNPNTVGTQTLTVTVDGKTATFTVLVQTGTATVTLQSITVKTPPAKTFYALGEALDISGLMITYFYSNNTSVSSTVPLSNITGYEPYKAGMQTLTVTVEGKQAFFNVGVGEVTGFTVNMEDPVATLPAVPTLSRTGQASVTLTISGSYASYEWFLNDSAAAVSTNVTYTLKAEDCRLGPNRLSVRVKTVHGAYYAQEITFTVIP